MRIIFSKHVIYKISLVMFIVQYLHSFIVRLDLELILGPDIVSHVWKNRFGFVLLQEICANWFLMIYFRPNLTYLFRSLIVHFLLFYILSSFSLIRKASFPYLGSGFNFSGFLDRRKRYSVNNPISSQLKHYFHFLKRYVDRPQTSWFWTLIEIWLYAFFNVCW